MRTLILAVFFSVCSFGQGILAPIRNNFNVSSGGGTHTFTHVSNPITSFGTGSSPLTTTLTTNPGTGHIVNLKCATFNNGSNTPPTLAVADSNSNAYTVTPGSPTGGFSPTSFNGWIFFAYLLSAPANATNSIIATFSSSTGGFAACFPDEYSYTGGGSAAFDTNVVGTGLTSPACTITGTNDLLDVVVTSASQNPSANSPWIGNASGSQASSWLSAYIENASSNTAVNWTVGSGSGTTVASLCASFK